MFQLYSKGCEYAIKALSQMEDPNQNYSAKNICRRARIPESFSRKVFQSLVHGRFLEAVPGPGGGYRLRQNLKEVSILDIIRAVDGAKAFDHCIMGFARCSEKTPCLLHDNWLKAKKHLVNELRERKLKDLISMTQKKRRNSNGKL